MNISLLMIVPLETTDERDAKYEIGVGRSDGQPGFSSCRLFFTLPSLIDALSQVRSLSVELASIEADMKAQATRIINVSLTKEDLELLGLELPH